MGFDVNGGNAEYMIAPALNALLLPDELSFAAGAKVVTDATAAATPVPPPAVFIR